MKNVTQKISVLLVTLFGAITGYSQVDLVAGISYSYQEVDANCEIKIDNIDICNNGNDDASPFDVTMYLYDQSTQDVYFVATTRMDNGVSGNSCITIYDWDFIINDGAIPAGTYRLGAWVDSDEEISESDEDNNTGLLTGDNDYTPCSGPSSVNDFNNIAEVDIYPNPTIDHVTIDIELNTTTDIEISVKDIAGKTVVAPVLHKNKSDFMVHKIDVSSLNQGMYLVHIKTDDGVVTRQVSITQ